MGSAATRTLTPAHRDLGREIRFQAIPGGIRVTFDHSEIPEGQGVDYQQGWVDHYLTPMRAWFQKQNTAASSPD